MPPKIKLMQEPVIPAGWNENVGKLRRDRGLLRRHNALFGLDSFTKPEDPLGYWIVFIRITTSATKMVDGNGNLVFDRRTRRPRMVYEYGFLPLIVDVEETVDALHRRIEDANVPSLRHQTFFLELDGQKMQTGEGRTMSNYFLGDNAVIFCHVEEKQRR